MRSRTEGARAWLLLCTGMSVATLLAGQSVMGSVVGQPLHVDGRRAAGEPLVVADRMAATPRDASAVDLPEAPERAAPQPTVGSARALMPRGDSTTAAQDDLGGWAWDFDSGLQGWFSWHRFEAANARGRVQKAQPAWIRLPGPEGGHVLRPVRDDVVAVPEAVAVLLSPRLDVSSPWPEQAVIRFRYRWHDGGVVTADFGVDRTGASSTRTREASGELRRTGDGWQDIEWVVPLDSWVTGLEVWFEVGFHNGLANGQCDPGVTFGDDECDLDFWLDDVEVELR